MAQLGLNPAPARPVATGKVGRADGGPRQPARPTG